MKTSKQISAFFFILVVAISTATAQENWTQSNTTSRERNSITRAERWGYSVRTNTGGDWAWQFVDGNNTSYFQVLHPTGNAGFGLNNLPWIPQTGAFEFRNGSTLGTANGSNRLLTCSSNTSGTNYFQNNVWARRVGSDNSWSTTRLHDAISIDGSFLTPGLDTRTWWERAPFQDFQMWGTGSQTYMALIGGSLWLGPVTQNTQYRLAVAGKIAAWDEIKVFTNGSSFPDYVFDADYKMRSLEDTESYIKENHHLPEVPSATEIEKEGMSLNGMSEILLKKVEELTLHLIEMKKESEMMKKEIEELKRNQKDK